MWEPPTFLLGVSGARGSPNGWLVSSKDIIIRSMLVCEKYDDLKIYICRDTLQQRVLPLRMTDGEEMHQVISNCARRSPLR